MERFQLRIDGESRLKTYLDCYPCFLRQALSAARRAGAENSEQQKVVAEVLHALQEVKPGQTPAEIAYVIHGIVRQVVDVKDPYLEAKTKSTREALALYDRLKSLVSESKDPLETAIRISIAGNIIDLAVSESDHDLWSTVQRVLNQPFAINDLEDLRRELAQADSILFLGDNAGETVFDRVLVESLEPPVIYAVKGGPMLNDATMEDAIAAGLDESATLISTGSDATGTVLSLCSDEFRETFDEASLIIAKGQANYETLSDAGPKVFCLLQVKCPVIEEDVGARVGSIVARRSG
jgi:hypothetical protein